MSGFYRVQRAHVPQGASAGSLNVQVVLGDAESFVLHSAIFPHPLEGVVPAVKIGDSWQDLWDALSPTERGEVFHAWVRRDGERMRVRWADVAEGDEIVCVFPPHRFAGSAQERIEP